MRGGWVCAASLTFTDPVVRVSSLSRWRLSGWWRFVLEGLGDADREVFDAIPGLKVGSSTVSAPANAAWIVEKILLEHGVQFHVAAPHTLPHRNASAALKHLREWVPAFLLDYQREGIDVALNWPDESGLLNWATGSGKSIPSQIWGLAGGSYPIVGVTKPAIVGQWAREARRISTAPVIELEGTRVDATTIPALPPPPYFLVIGYAVLPYWIDFFEKLRPRSVVFDEIQTVQSHKRWDAAVDLADTPAPGGPIVIEGGEQAPLPPVKVNFALKDNIAAAAYRLSRVARRRLGTTATPVRDRLRNVWAPLDLLRPWEFGGFYKFAKRYCDASEGPFGGIDTRGFSQENAAELKGRIALIRHHVPYSLANRILPPKRRQVTYVKVSEQCRPEAIAADLRRAAKLGPTAMLEMRIMEAASRKRKIVAEHVMDAIDGGLKVIVFTGRRRDVAALVETVEKRIDTRSVALFHGDGSISPTLRLDLCDRYMAAPAPAVLIGTGDAFGEGLNLQDTDVLLQPMLPYTPAQIIQREGRVCRLGQTRPALIHYFICEGTVDEHVAAILLNKLPAVEQTFDLDEVKGLGRELIGASEEELLNSLLSKVLGERKEP